MEDELGHCGFYMQNYAGGEYSFALLAIQTILAEGCILIA